MERKQTPEEKATDWPLFPGNPLPLPSEEGRRQFKKQVGLHFLTGS